MSEALILHGYGYSVYTRAVRMALCAKGVTYQFVDVDPFEEEGQRVLAPLHPFGRVPVFSHWAFQLYETQAILGYVDEVFDGPLLTPSSIQARARMRQVMGITDAYVYRPLVRQLFSHQVFAPLIGEAGDADEIAAGLAAAPRVLAALDDIAAEGLVLVPGQITQADCLLWSMMEYVLMAPQADELMAGCPTLSAWATALKENTASQDTRPDLSKLKGDTDV